jgi:hypothetical protein
VGSVSITSVETTAKIMQAIYKNRLARFFREHAKKCSLLKAFFLTENGYMGTAPYSVQQSNQIFLVSGSHVLLVLRLNVSLPNTFTLVCSAFVQGLTHGEKWRKMAPPTSSMTLLLHDGVQPRAKLCMAGLLVNVIKINISLRSLFLITCSRL